MKMRRTAYLLLGSNQGNCLQNLIDTRHLLGILGIEVVGMSSIYKTAPWGVADQPEFLNQALLVGSDYQPLELLKVLKDIEQKMGKEFLRKWGERIIDIDILFFEDMIINEPGLIIPHPRLHERNFTLIPLAEIASQYFHPVFKKSILELLAICPDRLKVEKTESYAV